MNGRQWLGLWSGFMLLASAYCIWQHRDLPGGVISVFGLILGSYSAHNTMTALKFGGIDGSAKQKAIGGASDSGTPVGD